MHLMVLHWMMAAFIFLLYATGILLVYPPPAALLDWLIPFLHQSLGILVLMLLIARFFLLLRLIRSRYARRSPKVTAKWLQTTILHGSLYFFMLIAPVSGFFLRNFIGLDTTFFGIPVSFIFAPNDRWVTLARSSHVWSSYIFLALIFLHILAHGKTAWINVKKRFIYRIKTASKKES